MESTRQLYGGAIVAALADEFKDVSDLRHVPDNQEVFVDLSSNASIIVELLELDQQLADDSALRFHYEELAQTNEAQDKAILSVCSSGNADPLLPNLSREHSRMALVGKQLVSKHRSPDAPLDAVFIVLVVARLRNVGTDVLLSLNLPIVGDAASNATIATIEQTLQASSLLPGSELPRGPGWDAVHAFKRLLDTFQVVDWGLFV